MSESAPPPAPTGAQACGDVSAGPGDSRPALSRRDRRILEFERDWARGSGAKQDAVRSEFGLSPTRYYQVLNALLDSPAALEHDPLLVRRLQRVRRMRTSSRTLSPRRTGEHFRRR